MKSRMNATPGKPADLPSEDLTQTLVGADWLATTIGCSSRHILRMVDAGLMPKPIKLGRLTRWRRCEIEQWLANGCPEV